MPMNDTVDEELFSYDVFNDVLAGMSRMLVLLESDRIEEKLRMILINRNLLNFVTSIRWLITKSSIR